MNTALHQSCITQTLGDSAWQQNQFPEGARLSIDSRTLQQGEVFVALSGERVDGHDFIGEALQKGAVGFVISLHKKDALLELYGIQLASLYILAVSDPYEAIMQLAYAWRSRFSYPVVAITGSVGKTSTKEMVKHILSVTGTSYFVAHGNQNTVLGVALNMLQMRSDHTVAVFELGIRHKGSMARLVSLLRPTIGAITKIALGHAATLGTIAAIAQEKQMIFSQLRAEHTGIIPGDQSCVTQTYYQHKIIMFGYKKHNFIQASLVKIHDTYMTCMIRIGSEKRMLRLESTNKAHIEIAMAALSIGYVLSIPFDQMIQGVSIPLSVKGRYHIKRLSYNSEVIDDCYNANPTSVHASLEAFEHYKTDKEKIIILADMLELGRYARAQHKTIGNYIQTMKSVDTICFIGPLFSDVASRIGAHKNVYCYERSEEVIPWLKDMLLHKNKVFLCKGSRGMNVALLISKLEEIKE